MGEDAGPRPQGITFEINSDVGVQLAHQLGCRAVGKGLHLDESVKTALEPGPLRLAVIYAVGEAVDFKTAAVMAFNQVGNEMGGRVGMIIRRNIVPIEPSVKCRLKVAVSALGDAMVCTSKLSTGAPARKRSRSMK